MLVILVEFIAGMQELMRVLVTDSGSVFAAILSVCSIFAGLGVMVQIAPIAGDGPEKLGMHKEKLITAFLICALLIGGGKGAQAFGVAHFSVAVGVKNAIGKILEETGNMERIASAKGITEESREQARAIMDTCIKMGPTLTTGEANPAFNECKNRLVETINSGGLAKAGTEIGANSPIEDMAKVVGSAFNAVGDAFMAVPKAIFEALKVGTALAEMLAYGLAMVMLPVAISWSLIDKSLLKKWVAGFWGVAMYGWALTILSGSFEIVNAKIGGSTPLFTAEVILALVAPFIASKAASQGAAGVYESLSRGVETAARAAAATVKG
jgi:hypothetical protein